MVLGACKLFRVLVLTKNSFASEAFKVIGDVYLALFAMRSI